MKIVYIFISFVLIFFLFSCSFIRKNKVVEDNSIKYFSYDIIEPGIGEICQLKDRVTIHYVGRLLDGKIYEDTESNKTPFCFVLGEEKVISGLEKGVLGMQIGEKRILYIPYSYGYGDKFLENIPLNSDLVIEVKLLKIDRRS